MEEVKLIIDSSANEKISERLIVVPLTISISGKDFIDDEHLNMADFLDSMAKNTEEGRTSCPSIDEWLKALEGSSRAIMLTITSGLSGSFSSAYQAKQIYEKDNPNSRVIVIDSRTAGPEVSMIQREIERLVDDQTRFVDIEQKISEYKTHTHLLFVLQSLHNLALNGRVSMAVAKVAKMLKINLVGTASEQGKLEPIAKVRGMKRSLNEILKLMNEMNYQGGRVIIDQCNNEKDAQVLKEKILISYPQAEIIIRPMHGLCAFYAEAGSLMVGFDEQ
ncbi:MULTISPECIES: DegV family protein [unclassified Lactobacillus]|uniref:DegV family protein n=1 Tax=unclassified Lactobacillus TaxID=2620435 RepID=UPI000EFA512A|nr:MULTISPECIES: DegV family protein [unclassified Lactobacillus]RMC39451.1 DegV family protein [Lactobacillus sp. ESL0237]RMC43515.1 DegV family protein [Lactobacillus sp. ESL0234]RMC44997.1 DegV family protein [Lactobacillus sp. ESL0236]RMC46599.1 DegV family protein [Lactobacillus sp. ESL0230]RMC50874.1 DegV family protein [Lactobacillus sp. ESL0225]